MNSTGKPEAEKPATDPNTISKEDWAEGGGASPDDFTEQEGGPSRSQPDPDAPAERADR